MDQSFKIAELISKQIKGSISESEKKELQDWLNESPENLATYNKAIDHKAQLIKLKQYNSFNKDKAWRNIEKQTTSTKIISLWTNKALRYAAAFLIPVMLAGGAAYFYFNRDIEMPIVKLDETVKPGVQKATLVLSNGESHELNPDNSESSLVDNNVQINNKNNALTYLASNDEPSEFKPAIYNDLITPKGGQYKLELADGTTVWLNADSKLTFPAEFTDSTRHLFLEGEAYFEVAHNGSPFIVTSNEMDVRVMGTSFNISAYSNDIDKEATLVEGKVRVDFRKNDNVVRELLSPNMQATVSSNASEISLTEVDASQYKSWVEGKFEFNNERLDEVLKKLARWYDFEYKFENDKAKDFHFSGRLNNDEKISDILRMMEMTTNVKFKVEENKVVVE